MKNDKCIIVVVPSFNVEREIKKAVDGIETFVDHIIIVDDCSTDRTMEVVNAMSDKRLKYIKTDRNMGVGGAVIAGFEVGLKLGGDIFIKYDGDGQMDPRRMVDLIEPLLSGECDYAKGNRFIHLRQLNSMPKIRLVGNFLLTFLTKLASGYWSIFDPQNGYVAIKKNTLQQLVLNRLDRGYFFENDMLVNLNIIGAKVKDISMPARYEGEKSSMKIIKVIAQFSILFAKNFIRRIYLKYLLYDFSVIGIFYTFGAVLQIFGFTFGMCVWAESIAFNRIATAGTVMIAVLPIIIGFQLFLEAIVLEVQSAKQ